MRLHKLIWLNKYIFIAYGLWPMRHDAALARRCFTNLRFFVGLSAGICLLLPEVMTVAAHWGDIDILEDVGSLIVIQCQLTFKNLYCLWRRQRFRTVYQQLRDFWWISDDPRERKHLERLAKMVKLTNTAFTLMAFSNVLSFEAILLFTWLKNRPEINEGQHKRPLLLVFYYELLSILQSLDTVKIVKFFILFVSRLMELIFLCTPAELLIQDSTFIAKTIYHEVPWSTLSPSLRRNFGVVIMRVQKECRVNAIYQVIAICRITGVVNSAGSYMALLRSMKK